MFLLCVNVSVSVCVASETLIGSVKQQRKTEKRQEVIGDEGEIRTKQEGNRKFDIFRQKKKESHTRT